MNTEQQSLLTQKRGLKMEMRLIVERHRILVAEIELRKKAIQSLLINHMALQDQCQDIADKLLQIEENVLISNNV